MNTSSFLIVAVDGGAASGKSSTSRGVARRLHLLYVDSGAHYRQITSHLLDAGIDAEEERKIENILRNLHLDTAVDGEGVARMQIDGVSLPPEAIRAPAINQEVSRYAASPAVRRFLYDYQRGQVAVAQAHGYQGLIMEGRDIGSVIFPQADFKFFLTASEEIRTRRRAAEGQPDHVRERDHLDSSRATAPFLLPGDAVVIHTDQHDLNAVVERICHLIAAGLGDAAG